MLWLSSFYWGEHKSSKTLNNLIKIWQWASGRARLRIQKSNFKSLLLSSPHSTAVLCEGGTGSWKTKDDSSHEPVNLQRELLLGTQLSANVATKDSCLPRELKRASSSLESGLACVFLWPVQCGRVMCEFWNLVFKSPRNFHVHFLRAQRPHKKAQTSFLNVSQMSRPHDSNITWNRDKLPLPNCSNMNQCMGVAFKSPNFRMGYCTVVDN